MSITFTLPPGYTTVSRADLRAAAEAACPECGGSPSYLNRRPASRDCGTCLGYGGDSAAEDRVLARAAKEDGEFNVSNANGAYIVRDILGSTDVYGGSIDPSTALLRLSAASPFAASGVRERSETRSVRLSAEGVSEGATFIDCGRSLSQVESYLLRLRRLAELAIERGAPAIIWY